MGRVKTCHERREQWPFEILQIYSGYVATPMITCDEGLGFFALSKLRSRILCSSSSWVEWMPREIGQETRVPSADSLIPE